MMIYKYFRKHFTAIINLSLNNYRFTLHYFIYLMLKSYRQMVES